MYLLNRVALIVSLCLAAPSIIRSQTSQPACFLVKYETITASQGDTVCLPVRVWGFQNVVAIQFTTTWDSANYEFIKVNTSNSVLPTLDPAQDFNFLIKNGMPALIISWFSFNSTTYSASDSSELFSVCLRVKTAAPGLHPVHISTSLSPNFEIDYFNGTGYSKYPFVQQTGGIVSGGPLPGDPLAILPSCVTPQNCQQIPGSITTHISGGVSPYTYQWTGPSGFTTTVSNPGNLQAGNYYTSLQ
jgi:hypothetical protein